jgi:hypothetical protein
MVRFPYKRIFDEILPTQYADVLGEIDEKRMLRHGLASSKVFFDQHRNMYLMCNKNQRSQG